VSIASENEEVLLINLQYLWCGKAAKPLYAKLRYAIFRVCHELDPSLPAGIESSEFTAQVLCDPSELSFEVANRPVYPVSFHLLLHTAPERSGLGALGLSPNSIEDSFRVASVEYVEIGHCLVLRNLQDR
jgi:hypothetical protein